MNSNLRHKKRDPVLSVQTNAPPELKVVSQPAGINLDNLPGYVYDPTSGEGITVFVLDYGYDSDNPVSAFSKTNLVSNNVRNWKEWLEKR